ncbi:class I SAM-dependent methyltransferase [Methyloceanibacter sp.]|uniref:class I SAM-dependent methyltransferase n=1 Tax=Methyloceanibacter sp. TaxID=1965321 RepID=UPI003D6D3DA0
MKADTLPRRRVEAVPSDPVQKSEVQTADDLRARTCPVCLATNFAPHFTTRGIPIESCESCGLLLQNPQPSDSDLAEIYGPHYFIGSDEDAELAAQFEIVKRATARLQLEELDAYLGKRGRAARGLRLLEIGCGHGNMLIEARASGYEVNGIEFSADAAAIANQKLGIEAVRVGSTSLAGFPDRSFDVCILADVIEHIRDPRAFLHDVWRMLDHHSTIFIATPSVDSWSARLLGRHWMEFKREHLFYFGMATIERLLTETGFADVTLGGGKKVLTPAYIIGHFDKFPVAVLSPVLRMGRSLAPSVLLQTKLKITASGIDVYATKP